MALNILPRDIAEEVKACAEKASWYSAKVRKGTQGEADAEKIALDRHFRKLKEKSEGLLSEGSCNEIKDMFRFAGWHTANTRAGVQYWFDANRDKRQMEEHYENLVKIGEVGGGLAYNLKWLGWNMAWYAANTIVGYNDDAIRDKAKIDSHYEQIQGEVNLVGMNFFMDNAKALTEKPKVVAEQRLVNNSDVQQSMTFTFSVTEGTTTSTSHEIGFSYGITVGFSAGFFDFAESKYEASFSFSHEHTFSQSMSNGTTKTYEFPLAVPARKTYIAKGLVHEANMEVPYELVFDFGGTRKSIKGVWNGVAVSKATYQIDTV